MIVAGLDAGKSGALAILETTTDEVEIFDLILDHNETLDTYWLFNLLLDKEITSLVTEDTFRPKSLVRMTGEVIAVCKILQIPVAVVAVVSWKKAITGTNSSNKQISIDKCKELIPATTSLLKKPRARTDSSDRAEAVLLAIYNKNLLLKKV